MYYPYILANNDLRTSCENYCKGTTIQMNSNKLKINAEKKKILLKDFFKGGE
jgi:hypothetical protein